MKDALTNTNLETGNIQLPSLADLSATCKQFENTLPIRFEGLVVQVDKDLQGNEYYIAISRELYEKLKIKEAENKL